MDYTTIVVAIFGFVTSIGAVSVFLKNYMPAVSKWTMVAKDAVETLADIADALKDGALSADEITKLKVDVETFKAALSTK